MNQNQKWPDTLWLVRHGESAANVAWAAADAAGTPVIDIALRDVDVPLSSLGEEQSVAVGRWFGALPLHEQPTVVLVSPYIRAQRTADLLLAACGLDITRIAFAIDERLRERELGILNGLTKVGVAAKYPEEAILRTLLGKLYYRPPGGESWCDVIVRLRSVIETITREHRQERVLVVAHSVVVLCFRYLLERLSEEQILEIDRAKDVANCSVTSYRCDPTQDKNGKLVLSQYNYVAPLAEAGAPITTQPDAQVAPK